MQYGGSHILFYICVANFIFVVMQRYEEINKVGEGRVRLTRISIRNIWCCIPGERHENRFVLHSNSVINRRNCCPEEDPFEFPGGRNPQHCNP